MLNASPSFPHATTANVSMTEPSPPRSQTSGQDESDLGEPLPPLDKDADGDEPINVAFELPALEAEGGTDDEEASDLDVGLSLETLEEGGDDEPDTGVVPISELLADVDEDSSGELGDEAGPTQFDMAAGLTDVEDLDEPDNGEHGIAEPLDDLVSEELPALDADLEGDFEAETDESWFAQLAAGDEEPPAWTEPRWSVARVTRAPATCLLGHDGAIYAGGSEVTRMPTEDSASADTIGSVGTRVASLAACGDLLFAASAIGGLFRLDPTGRCTEVERWRETVGARPGEPVSLELVSAGRERLVARASSGALIWTADGGSSWTRVDDSGQVSAIARSFASPLVALSVGRQRSSLLCSSDGRRWIPQSLDQTGVHVASGDQPMIAAAGSLVVLADSRRGVAVSTDGGVSFERPAGCSNVQAVCVGALDTPTVWLAAYREARDVTEIIAVDATTCSARRVALVELHAAHADEPVEGSRVTSMVYDSRAGALWIAGEFGVAKLAPPPQ